MDVTLPFSAPAADGLTRPLSIVRPSLPVALTSFATAPEFAKNKALISSPSIELFKAMRYAEPVTGKALSMMMPRFRPSLYAKVLMCLLVLASTSACSNSISQQLLNSRSGPSADLPVNQLAMPPADALQVARPDQSPGFVEETDLPADVPTLAELSTRPVEGIDAPKVGLKLEADSAAHKIGENILWRGKRGADGVDLANRSGVLCSGSRSDVSAARAIKVACSDGRIGSLRLITGAGQTQIAFSKGLSEAVEFEN
jgi:hypothetical protein